MKRDSESESSKVENIASRFFSKCLHVILESRYVSSSPSKMRNGVGKGYSDVSRRDKWFNLALRDSPPVLENTDVHYSTQLVIDLVLLHRSCKWDFSGKNGDDNSGSERGKVIERWVMMYEGKKGRDRTGSLKGSCRSHVFYNKCVLMLRSLYVMVKLLPAYKLFKDLTASVRQCEFSLVHHISSFVEPFTRKEEAETRKYVFDTVETSYGSLCLSVIYLSSLVNFKMEPSYEVLPQIINDYCRGYSAKASVSRAPVLHVNGMVTSGSKSSGHSKKPWRATESGFCVVTHAQQKCAKGVKSGCSAITNQSCRRSHLLDAPTHPVLSTVGKHPTADKTSPRAQMVIRPSDILRSQVDKCKNPEDTFPPQLSENAAIGSLFSTFHTAAPLRPSSTDLQAAAGSTTSPANPSAKTTMDALRELQDHIDMKNKIIHRKSST